MATDKRFKRDNVFVKRLTFVDPLTLLAGPYIENAGDGTVKIFADDGTGIGLDPSELGLINGVTAGIPAASKALTLNSAGKIAAFQTSDGVGAAAGTGVTAAEFGSGAVHKTVLTLAALSIATTDNGAAGAQGSQKVYDFPEGVITVLGCSYNLTTLAGAGGIADTAALVGSLGSAAAGAGDATLTGTEADLIASTTGTLTAGAGVLAKYGSLVAAAFDGHTTPLDAILNIAVPDAGSSAADTVTISGTITICWINIGDF